MDKPEDESLHGWLKRWMGQYWVRGCMDKRVVGIVHGLAKENGWAVVRMGQWMGGQQGR